MTEAIDTYEDLRTALLTMRADGVSLTTIADSAEVGKASVSKFINFKSKHLRGDVLLRLCRVAHQHREQSDAR